MPQIEEPETERKLIFQRAPSIRNQVFKKKKLSNPRSSLHDKARQIKFPKQIKRRNLKQFQKI